MLEAFRGAWAILRHSDILSLLWTEVRMGHSWHLIEPWQLSPGNSNGTEAMVVAMTVQAMSAD